MSGYLIIDSENTLVGEEPFPSEREAYRAKRVYEDNCSDVALPLRVVRADSVFPLEHPQLKSLSEAESERVN